METILRFYELYICAELILDLLQAAFEHVAHFEPAPDLLCVDWLALQGKHR